MRRNVLQLRGINQPDLWFDGRTAGHIRDWCRGKDRDFIRKNLGKKLERLKESDCDIGVQVYASLINIYVKSGWHAEALKVFSDSQQRWPTAILPATAICRMFAATGETEKVLQMLNNINSWGHRINDSIRESVLLLCSKMMYSSLAVKTLADCDEIQDYSVALAISSLKRFDHAQQLLEIVSRNCHVPSSWSTHIRRTTASIQPYENTTDSDVTVAVATCLKYVQFNDKPAIKEAHRILLSLMTVPGYGDLSITLGLSVLKEINRSMHRESRTDEKLSSVAAAVIKCCAIRDGSVDPTARRSDAELAWKLSNKSAQSTSELLYFYAAIRDREAIETLFREVNPSEEVRRAYIESCISVRGDKPSLPTFLH